MMKPRLRTVLAAVVACVLAISVYAGATSSGWIFLGGPIADQMAGTPPLGECDITLASSTTPHVATQAEYQGFFLKVTSSVALTSPVTIQLPLQPGTGKLVFNGTTGAQTINIAGATGAPAAVAPGTLAVVGSDGVNYYAVSGGGGGGGFDAGAIPNILPILTGYVHGNGSVVSYQSTIPVADLVGVLSAAQGGTGLSGVCPNGTYITSDGGVFYCSPAYVSPPAGSDIEAGAAGQLFDIGWAGHGLAASSFLAPPDGGIPYAGGDGLWHASALACSGGDMGCTSAATTLTGTVLSATGTGSNEYVDGGGAVWRMAATEECLDSNATSLWCASTSKIVFSDTTTWVPVVQRTATVNENLHEFLTVCADDYSADGGSVTKNFACSAVQVHVVNDTAETLFVPSAGSDVGPGPMTIGPAGSTVLSGCTTNNSDAGCVPGSGFSSLFSARSRLVSGVAVTELQGTGLTRFPWKGSVLAIVLRRNP